MDADGRADVGDDQQWRVVEGDGVSLELDEGGVEVRLGFLVLPREETPFEDVSEAIAASGLRGAHLKAIVLPGRVRFRRRWLAQHPAQVHEMLLSRCSLLQR